MKHSNPSTFSLSSEENEIISDEKILKSKPEHDTTSGVRFLPNQWHRFIYFTKNAGGTYKSTVLSQAFLSFFVFIANLTVLLVSIAKYPVTSMDGTATVYSGNCEVVQRSNTAAHIIINFLSTTILSASNYCMQCTSAPTREEVNRAHSQMKTASIGVPSLRNLFLIPWRRRIVWAILGLSSVPLHLLYNSAIFKTQSGIEYDWFLIREGFLDQRNLNTSASTSLSQNLPTYMSRRWIRAPVLEKQTYTAWDTTLQRFANDGRTWSNLSVAKCQNEYGQNFVAKYSTLLLVTSSTDYYNTSFANGTFIYRGIGARERTPYSWMCGIKAGDSQDDRCDPNSLDNDDWSLTIAATNFEENQKNLNTNYNFKIDYCLAEPAVQHCEPKYSRLILITVCVMNMIKMICMIYIAFLGGSDEPLLTVGDTVSSFLQNQDETTKDKNDWSGRDFKNWKWALNPKFRKSIFASSRRWIRGASKGKWIACMLLSFTVIAITAFFFVIAIVNFFTDVPKSEYWKTMMRAGMGEYSPSSLISGFSWVDTPMYAIVIANAPQLLLSFLYLMYNSIFTSMLAEREWTSFGLKPARLRVTFPQPGQARTQWLQLPYRWGIPLGLLSFVLHWLVSQAIFFAQVTTLLGDTLNESPRQVQQSFIGLPYYRKTEEGRVIANVASVCGYSVIGIGSSMILGLIALVVVLLIGIFKKYLGELPIGGTCSAVVSASCHGVLKEDSAFQPVQWGAVPRLDGGISKGFFNISDEEYTFKRELRRKGTFGWKLQNWYQSKLGELEEHSWIRSRRK